MAIVPTRPRPRHGLPSSKRAQIVRYLQLGWRPDAISKELSIGLRTVYDAESNIARYGSVVKLLYTRLGRPFKFTDVDKEAVLELLLQEGWRQQAEIVHWLMLKSKGWTKKKLYCLSLMRSELLRKDWQQDMSQFTADDLIFLDESIFNERTGWRSYGWAPIGEDA